MPLSPLPTSWNVFNLRSSPYWQESLGGSDEAHPLSLFVGRTAELKGLEAVIYGAGASSSRQAIAGPPGIGKTTLVKQFKAQARAHGYLTIDDFVGLQPNDTPEALFGRVLTLVYETILANRPMTAGNAAMLDTQQLVRVGHLRTGGGVGASLLGAGRTVTHSGALTTPRDVLTDGVRILGRLIELIRGAEARGILVHLDNLEILSEADASASATILRALRDPMLMHPGLHVVIAGTADAVSAVVNTYAQLRSVFTIHAIPSLSTGDVHRLLAERYKHECLATEVATIPPVDAEGIEALHALYRGDLRGFLKALEVGVRPNIGRAVTTAPDGTTAVRSLSLAEIQPTLQQRFTEALDALKEKKRVDQLKSWGQRAPDAMYSQADLQRLWNVSQGAVSTALSFLTSEGYVVALRREGAGSTRYALSGTSRLIFA